MKMCVPVLIWANKLYQDVIDTEKTIDVLQRWLAFHLREHSFSKNCFWFANIFGHCGDVCTVTQSSTSSSRFSQNGTSCLRKLTNNKILDLLTRFMTSCSFVWSKITSLPLDHLTISFVSELKPSSEYTAKYRSSSECGGMDKDNWYFRKPWKRWSRCLLIDWFGAKYDIITSGMVTISSISRTNCIVRGNIEEMLLLSWPQHRRNKTDHPPLTWDKVGWGNCRAWSLADWNCSNSDNIIL